MVRFGSGFGGDLLRFWCTMSLLTRWSKSRQESSWRAVEVVSRALSFGDSLLCCCFFLGVGVNLKQGKSLLGSCLRYHLGASGYSVWSRREAR